MSFLTLYGKNLHTSGAQNCTSHPLKTFQVLVEECKADVWLAGGDGHERAAWCNAMRRSFYLILPFVLFLKATPQSSRWLLPIHENASRERQFLSSSSSCAGFTSLCNVIHFRSHGQITIIIKIKTGGSWCGAQPIVITKWRKSCAHNERIWNCGCVCAPP